MALRRSIAQQRESRPRRAWGFVLENQGIARWITLGLFWLLALVLGFIGFVVYCVGEGTRPDPWIDPYYYLYILYLAFQLFTLESGAVYGPHVSWQLEVARILAPAVMLIGLYQAISKIVGEQLNRARTWGLKGHVVIAGLGDKGTLLAQAYRDAGQTVLVVERQEAIAATERDAYTVIGDATDPAVQRRARVQDAAVLIAATGDDGTNVQVARTASQLCARRPGDVGRLACVVHILDIGLWDSLHTWGLGQHQGFDVEFVNLFHIGALELLADDAVRTVATPETPVPTPHLLVVGAGWFRQTLVMRAARLWQDQPKLVEEPMRITLVDREARRRMDELLSP